MHRHGYKGRKLGRKRDPRRLLIRNLAIHFINRGELTTTVAKAKEVLPFIERLITKARRADLHQRRQILSRLDNIQATHRLCDYWVPRLSKERKSGYLRLVQEGFYRRGDGALLARLEFVDKIKDGLPTEVVARQSPKIKKRAAQT